MGAMIRDGIRVEEGDVNDIPFLLCSPDNKKAKPLIILSHQFMRSKLMWTRHLKELATLDYCAVALDNRGHGERKEASFESVALVEGKVNVCAVRMFIKETAEDVPALLDYFVTQDGVDADRIGMVGVSMGGFITFRALVLESRIRVAATMIASPYWDDVPEDMPIVEDPEALAALRDYSMRYSPARHVDRFYPRPLLIELGSKDEHFSQERVLGFYRDLGKYYQGSPEKLKLKVHEETGHEFTPAMWEDAKRWLQTHL